MNFFEFDILPSMGLVAANVLTASEKVIITFVPEVFGVRGLIRIVKSGFRYFRGRRYDVGSRTVLHSEMLQQARRYCLENQIHMIEKIIPRSIYFANSTVCKGKNATWTFSSNPIIKAYFELKNNYMKQK